VAGNELERGDIVVHRSVTVDEDELLDELTAFAVSHGLQVRRHDDGQGMLFVRKSEMPVQGKELIRTGDTLRVILTPTPSGTDIVLLASMEGLHKRGDDWKQGRAVRGFVLSAFFATAGVAGMTNGLSFGDFVMTGLGAWFAMRTVTAVRGEGDDRREFEHDVADELEMFCDRLDR